MSTVRIQVRRGSSSDWTSVNPVLAAGEIGFETNTKKMKVGDGSSTWSSLDYISSDAPAISEISQDAINSALTMGDGISKVYDDAGNTITLENTGVLSFNTRTGSITLTDSDINTALGYTAADAADVSGLGTGAESSATRVADAAEDDDGCDRLGPAAGKGCAGLRRGRAESAGFESNPRQRRTRLR